MLDRTVIRQAAIQTLKAANTAAGASVFSPLDWPTESGSYPVLIVRTPRESKENAAPRSGPPTFFSIITLTVTGRIEATTEAGAEMALEQLSEQIENALLTNAQFVVQNGIQQFTHVEATMEVRSESELHYGETVVTFALEVYQQYAPVIDAAGNPIGPSLTDVNLTLNLKTGESVDAGFNLSLTGG